MRKVFSLLLALLILVSLAVPALAKSVDDPGTVNIGVNKTKKVVITPDLNAETSTDLFGNFKGVMPGDKLTETISIRNWALQYDYIKVYLEADPHGKSNAPKIGDAHDADFLSQLTMQVSSGGKVIYLAGPDEKYQLDEAGSLKNPVYLGKLTKSNAINAMDLKVTLTVPLTMDNSCADAMGEVDWVFTFEGYTSDSPKTGDYVIMGAVALMAVSAAALVILFLLKKKRKN